MGVFQIWRSQNAIRTLLFSSFSTRLICKLLRQFEPLYSLWNLAYPYSSCCLRLNSSCSQYIFECNSWCEATDALYVQWLELKWRQQWKDFSIDSQKVRRKIKCWLSLYGLGLRLYWLVWSVEIRKLVLQLKTIIVVFSHSLFYNTFRMHFSKTSHPYLKIPSWKTRRTGLSSEVLLVFDSIQFVVQFSTASSSTKIYHVNHGFAGKNLSPQNWITVSKSLNSLILMKTMLL